MQALCVSFRDLISQSGGVRVSASQQAIDLLVPAMQPLVDDPSCMPHPEYLPYDVGYDFPAVLLTYGMDFPKVANVVLSADDNARQFGLHIVCDQGLSCPPDQDRDHDGWCDDVDLCPDTVTGANCERDWDGFGDAHAYVWNNCLSATFEYPSSEQQRTERFKQARQFYCGGCDNCEGVPNPDAYPALPPIGELHWLEGRYLGQSPSNANTVQMASRQLDFDRDWLGDACDPDIDGDGVVNSFDCDDHNACLGRDLDQDTVCEAFGVGRYIDGECDSLTR